MDENGPQTPEETLDAEIKSFFDSAPPLRNIENISGSLKNFIEINSSPAGKFSLS